ncbi:hepatoma-derived growth factor-related protein 2 isoform X3 [Helianthus annuus]|uniref:hepatoma-derived growth factor-related protein 2 isoform X3 n=1 Tax=Helianthus annuus TaxID=4232 RepID=UPI000B8F95D6|nr:hepatoma-derived growth factor-related protein 2 isoform X3 [Helianthus annuus]
MASADAELERQLKEIGKQLSHPHDSVEELLHVLDKVEKLLLKVDQSPKWSMLTALRPSMNALIKDSLSKHSDIDVKVAVASCISEITRITAPDAPYTDDQMRDVFELIVSSFEDLSDRSSRSYNKRASILETVSKVRSCVIMLDLECDELIVRMFDHFLKAVRDFHMDSVYSSMENIMELVIDESEEISVEMLKPLLACVKKDRVGVLPVAHKLAKGVLLKSAEKLKPYMMPALTSLGESLDMYHKVVAAVCDGAIANIENKDDDEPANVCKLEKGSVDEVQQADESKLTTASSDHVDQVVKSETCPKEEVDPTVENKSPKSVMSNGVNETVKEEASVDQESKKLEEEKTQESINKEDTDDSDADKLVKEKPQTEKIADKSETEADCSHVEGDKEIEKDNDAKELENEKENDVKEPETEKDNDVKESENEKDSDVKEAEEEKDNDVKESENEKDNDVKESENEKDNDVKESEDQKEKDNDVKESENKAAIPPETEKDKDTVQEVSPKAVESTPAATANVSSPSQSGPPPDESSDRSKTKVVLQEVEAASPSKSGPTPDETHVKKTPEAQKQAGKKTATAKEVKRTDTVNKSEDGEASSDSDAKPLKKSESKSKSKSTKQSGKKSKQSGKKSDVGQSDAKKPKPSAKDVDVKGDESDSDSDNKPLKLSAKKSTSKKKDDGNKRGNGKNVAEKDQAKSVSGDDEMDVSPKSAPKSTTETPVTSAKRKRSTSKDEVSNTIKYDESLIGKKVKVWWPEDKMYYEGVVTEFFPAKKKHKVSYVDGDEEKLNMRTQKWEIIKEFTVRNDEEPNTEVQSDEGSPEMNKKKKSKTDPAASQEKIKDSAKKAGSVSSSGKSKGSTSKDNKAAQKTSGKLSDKEDEETLKTSSKTKSVNKSKGKTPPSSSKSNTAKSNAKEPEDVKSTENTKSGSNKRKKRT